MLSFLLAKVSYCQKIKFNFSSFFSHLHNEIYALKILSFNFCQNDYSKTQNLMKLIIAA